MDRSKTGIERFDALDVLRGIAALAIVDLHMDDGIVASVCPHGYSAVDLFFVLSGFVMAHAYGDRLRSGRLEPVMFMRDRLIRLMPTIVLGSVLGFVFVLTRIVSGAESGSPVDAVEAFLLGGQGADADVARRVTLGAWWPRSFVVASHAVA